MKPIFFYIRIAICIIWFVIIFTCLIWLDVLENTQQSKNVNLLLQHQLGLTIDMTSASISVLSLVLMAVALGIIYWYLKKLQSAGKF